MISSHNLQMAADVLSASKHTVAFTGAGISVESGISPFRGPGGIWEREDPAKFEKRWFVAHPEESWILLKKLFYEEGPDKPAPNPAHEALARLEQAGLLSSVITQNIDNLHYAAGSRTVHEFHGTIRLLDCLQCRQKTPAEQVSLNLLPPPCPVCGGLLKPDIVFFGEPIPEKAHRDSLAEAQACEAMLVIGTTGEVMPASRLPLVAKNKGATIIEVNVQPSAYTGNTTDIFLQGRAGETLSRLADMVIGK